MKAFYDAGTVELIHNIFGPERVYYDPKKDELIIDRAIFSFDIQSMIKGFIYIGDL